MTRVIFLASPERLEAVRSAAIAADIRFGGIAVRAFSVKGGSLLCPPGSAFVAALEACPDAFVEVAIVDPEIQAADLPRIARCLAPGAEMHGKTTRPAVPAADLESWWKQRGAFVSHLLASKAAKSLHAAVRMDDLLLEAVETYSDRLLGQPRSKTLAFPGLHVTDKEAWSELPPVPDIPPVPQTPPGQEALGQALADAIRRGREIAANRPSTDAPVTINVIGSDTAAITALGYAGGLTGRQAYVRIVDRSAARLGVFFLLYREARFLVRRRVAFRWCPEPDQMPPADIVVGDVNAPF